jgi:large subunit ribosomal protein L24
MGASLDKKLREKYGMRSVEIRKGDDVKVMRGKFAKKTGKVGKVDVGNSRIQIDGLQRAKKGGEKVETWFHPSNVKIVVLDDSDNKRFKRKDIKKEVEKKVEEKKTAPKGVPPAQTASAKADKVGKTKAKEKKE